MGVERTTVVSRGTEFVPSIVRQHRLQIIFARGLWMYLLGGSCFLRFLLRWTGSQACTMSRLGSGVRRDESGTTSSIPLGAVEALRCALHWHRKQVKCVFGTSSENREGALGMAIAEGACASCIESTSETLLGRLKMEVN